LCPIDIEILLPKKWGFIVYSRAGNDDDDDDDDDCDDDNDYCIKECELNSRVFQMHDTSLHFWCA